MKLAEAYGCYGLRCDSADQVDEVLEKALAATDVPAVVDFRVHDREGVFPMVAAGQPNDEIVLGPEFSADEQRAAARRVVARARQRTRTWRPDDHPAQHHAHAVRAGGEQARRARARGRAVLPAGVQYQPRWPSARPPTTGSAG